MFRNYFKIGVRNLTRNLGTSLINISGLSVSVGCAMTTFLFADFFFDLNSFHQNAANIYQVVSHVEENGEEKLFGPSASILKEQLTGHEMIESLARLHYVAGNVKFGKNVFRERIMIADPELFDVFDFPLTQGSLHQFQGNVVVINQHLAKKYFGDLDPIGKAINIKFDHSGPRSFKVAGVLQDVPSNNSFKPAILLPFDRYESITGHRVSWLDDIRATFVLLHPNYAATDLRDLMSRLAKVQNEANPRSLLLGYELITLGRLSKIAGAVQERTVYGNDEGGTIGIAAIGFLLLLFACLNYVNIAIASAAKRLKEIGIRKVMGSTRINIVIQFLVENFILSAVAMILGVSACYFLLLPGFNYIAPVEIPFAFSSTTTAILYLSGLFVLLGVLSGSYPAFYISKFQALGIFRGTNKIAGKNRFTRILLTIQFFLAFLTILSCFIFVDNGRYVKELSWGYDPADMLALQTPDAKARRALESLIDNDPKVETIASSYGHIGVRDRLLTFQHLETKFKALHYDVRPGYLSTLSVPLVAGRVFEETEGESNTAIVNELFLKQMNWEDALGKQIDVMGESKTIVGVTGDVNHDFFDEAMRPMIFTSGQESHDFLIVKATPGSLRTLDQSLAVAWEQVIPDDPYERYIQADLFDRDYTNVDANNLFMLSTAVMTILLSCLGLYGLLSFTLQQRVKEFSIRKVLGANISHLIHLSNREYFWILIVALGLGTPVSIWLMSFAVEWTFTFAKPFSLTPVVVSIGITLITILITVFGQIRRAVKVNPAEILRGD